MPFPMGGWQRLSDSILILFFEFALYYTFLVSLSLSLFFLTTCLVGGHSSVPLCISHRLIRSIPSYAVFLDHPAQPWFSFF
jgi:hypothetical protein